MQSLIMLLHQHFQIEDGYYCNSMSCITHDQRIFSNTFDFTNSDKNRSLLLMISFKHMNNNGVSTPWLDV